MSRNNEEAPRFGSFDQCSEEPFGTTEYAETTAFNSNGTVFRSAYADAYSSQKKSHQSMTSYPTISTEPGVDSATPFESGSDGCFREAYVPNENAEDWRAEAQPDWKYISEYYSQRSLGSSSQMPLYRNDSPKQHSPFGAPLFDHPPPEASLLKQATYDRPYDPYRWAPPPAPSQASYFRPQRYPPQLYSGVYDLPPQDYSWRDRKSFGPQRGSGGSQHAQSPKTKNKRGRYHPASEKIVKEIEEKGVAYVDPDTNPCIKIEKCATFLSPYFEMLSIYDDGKRLIRFSSERTRHPVGLLREAEISRLLDLRDEELKKADTFGGFYHRGRTYCVHSFRKDMILALQFKCTPFENINRPPIDVFALTRSIVNHPEFAKRTANRDAIIMEGLILGYPDKNDSYELWFSGENDYIYVIPNMDKKPDSKLVFRNTDSTDTSHPNQEMFSKLEARGIPNVGSVGHDCNKDRCVPCQFQCYGVKECKMGKLCENCHMQHDRKKHGKRTGGSDVVAAALRMKKRAEELEQPEIQELAEAVEKSCEEFMSKMKAKNSNSQSRQLAPRIEALRVEASKK